MMKYFLLFLLLLVVPGLAFGYGFKTVTCSCGSSLANTPVRVTVGLNNTGGMNIFYYSTDSDRQTENLYANVAKDVVLKGNADASGNVPIYVSTNYNDSFSLSCGACSADYSGSVGSILLYSVGIAFGLFTVVGLAKVLGG